MSDESNTLDLTNVPDNVEEEVADEEEEVADEEEEVAEEEEEVVDEEEEEEDEEEEEEDEEEEEEEEEEGDEEEAEEQVGEEGGEEQPEEEEEQAEEEGGEEEEVADEEEQEEQTEEEEGQVEEQPEEEEQTVEETVEDVEEEQAEQPEQHENSSELTDDLKQRIAELDYLRECCGNSDWMDWTGRGTGRRNFLTAWENKNVSVDSNVNYEDTLNHLEKFPELIKLWVVERKKIKSDSNHFKNIESYTLEKPLFNEKSLTEKVEVVEQLLTLLTKWVNKKISVTRVKEFIDNLY